MSVRYQPVIDCADPDRQAHFWVAALGYEFAPPPTGFATWDSYYRDLFASNVALVALSATNATLEARSQDFRRRASPNA